MGMGMHLIYKRCKECQNKKARGNPTITGAIAFIKA